VPSCEEWFKRQLGNIQDGTAEVKTSSKWTSMLRILGNCKASKFTEAHRSKARDLLSNVN
jgi:hypothetical protein